MDKQNPTEDIVIRNASDMATIFFKLLAIYKKIEEYA